MSSRITFRSQPFDFSSEQLPWSVGIWPVSWLCFPGETPTPAVAAFRLFFSLPEAALVRVHVSADERYELFLNGERIGRGPERATPDFWPFDSYELALREGENVIVARVQRLGQFAPAAQLTSAPGFLLAPDTVPWLEQLGTGHAPWEVKFLNGYTFSHSEGVAFVGGVVEVDGSAFDWNFERGESEGWLSAKVGQSAADEQTRTDFDQRPLLRPSVMPPQIARRWTSAAVRYVAPFSEFPTGSGVILQADSRESEVEVWQQLWDNQAPITIAPQSRRRVIVDLQDYVCGYPQLRVSGGKGALVRWHWQEALLEEVGTFGKGQRDEIEGKFFAMPGTRGTSTDGFGDTFRPDGGQHRLFEVLHWRCGRFLEICVETRDEPLVLEELAIEETRYPLENEGQFEASDPRFSALTPLLVRSMQMCSHETYMDCPFYEQLQYVGDTRLEVLTTFVMMRDDTLPRQALRAFDRSRLVGGSGNGLTQSRTPSRTRQVIPPFSLWWVAMVHDYALWRDDLALIRELLPGVRAVLDAFRGFCNAQGLVEALPGWNFGDWARSENAADYGRELWPAGMPPCGHQGVSALFNWQFALVLRLAGDLETWFGDELLAQRHLRDAQAVGQATHAAFWNESRGLWADDLSHQNWSEHTQCLAILSSQAPVEAMGRAGGELLRATDLTRTTIYFSHYLLETHRVLKQADALFGRLEKWFDLPAQGFKTTPEQPEPTRSDCHAWGAHPLFHFHASILGIRPSAPGFRGVEIRPQLGQLHWARAVVPHPDGEIRVALQREEASWHAEIELPTGLEGTFHWEDQQFPLRSGFQILEG